MTQTTDEAGAFQALRARNEPVRAVRSLLKGAGLEIREREKELVISNPGDPEMRRIYITYATGEVSLRQVLWDYWGYLDGYGRALWADPENEPGVEVDRTISTLGGRMSDSS
jgi:hypothetical protein